MRRAFAAALVAIGLVVVSSPSAPAFAAAVATTTHTLISLDQQVAALSGQGLVPPDTSFAVGPTRIVEVVNSNYSVWDKATGAKVAGPTAMTTLLNPSAGYRVSDPRVMYDAATGRWFISAMSFKRPFASGEGGRVHLAVSQTSDPTGAWFTYVVATDSSGIIFDQPRIGLTDDKVVIAWDNFDTDPGPEAFTGAQFVVLQKSQAVAGNQPTAVTSASSTSRFAIVPAQNQGPGVDAYLVHNLNLVSAEAAGVIKVTGTPSGANVAATETSVPIRATTPPPASRQNGPETLDTGDDRFLNAVWMANKLWVGGGTACRPAGDTVDRACNRLVQLSTAGSPSVLQDFDMGEAGTDLSFPGVTFNGLGDLFVGFTRSSATTFASVAGAGQLSSDVNRITETSTVKAGEATYDQAACGFSPAGDSRWGDYGFGSLDPSDPKMGWVGGEYAKAAPPSTPTVGCDWGTAASRMTFPAPTITAMTPSLVTANGPVGAITIDGRDFSASSQVLFDGAPAGAVTVVSSTRLTVVPPQNHGPGDVAVTVVTGYGTSNPATLPYLAIPVVSSLSPSVGSTEGGTVVTITGTNFAGVTLVRFGGVPAPFSVQSPTTITAVAPAHGVGPVDVVVSNQSFDSAPRTFTFAPPGYRMVASDGGIFTFGDAGFFGSTGNLRLNSPIVGMASTPSGGGYWLVAADGGIFAFGDAGFFGSAGNLRLNSPIVGMAPTPSGRGYWFVAGDGGIFSFGDAPFFGSTGDIRLNRPIVGMDASPTGAGYWFVASDGGVFTFGDAGFLGSTGNIRLNLPIVGMAAGPSGQGYRLVASDGGIFAFGDAGFFGSTGDIRLNRPIVGIA